MSHPLLCWDIVMEGMGRRKEFAHDIAALDQLFNKTNCYLPFTEVENSVIWENKTVIVTDIDLHMILATRNMYEMNGYKNSEVIGKPPSMFQGAGTETAIKKKIRTAVEKAVPFEYTLINYRKDGRTYNCHIQGYPIFNRQGNVINFIALERAA